jgi:hypothetical protein
MTEKPTSGQPLSTSQPRAYVVAHPSGESFLGRSDLFAALSFVPFAFAYAFATVAEAEQAQTGTRQQGTTVRPLYATGRFGALSLQAPEQQPAQPAIATPTCRPEPTDHTQLPRALGVELIALRTNCLSGRTFALDTHASMDALRSARAEAAVTIGTDYDYDQETDRQMYGADLVANLRHWADAHGLDWAWMLEQGQGHYDAEVAEARAQKGEAD